MRDEPPQTWEYNDRFEELDTDEDGLYGVELDPGFPQNQRFVSDELRFTGIDLGDNLRRRRSNDIRNHEYVPPLPEVYDEYYGLVRTPSMQMLMKEKEDIALDSARERIAHARALGKTSVNLSAAELDALERSDRSQPTRVSAAPTSAPKSKKSSPAKTRILEQRKSPSKADKSGKNSPKAKPLETRTRGRSTASNSSDRDSAEQSQSRPYPLLPNDPSYAYSGGALAFGPQVFYPPAHHTSSRASSTQSLRQQHHAQAHPQVPLMPVPQQPYYQARYFSNPEALYTNRTPPTYSTRADPADPEWEPRNNPNNNLVNVPLEDLGYTPRSARAPRFDPMDPRYGSPTRRVVSGPSAGQGIRHPLRRRYTDESHHSEDRFDAPGHGGTSEDDDGDPIQGVRVNMSEGRGGHYAIETRSAGKKSGSPSKSGLARAKKAR